MPRRSSATPAPIGDETRTTERMAGASAADRFYFGVRDTSTVEQRHHDAEHRAALAVAEAAP
jgi:hypothetical protein